MIKSEMVLTVVLGVLALVVAANLTLSTLGLAWLHDAEANIAQLNVSVGKIELRMADVQKDITSIHKRITSIDQRLDRIESRMDEFEQDPRVVLARFGVKIGEEFAGAFINKKVYVFPRTTLGQKMLEKAGFELHSFTPTLAGYAITK